MLFLDGAATGVQAYLGFAAAHRAKLHTANPLEHVNGESKLGGNLRLIGPRSCRSTRSCLGVLSRLSSGTGGRFRMRMAPGPYSYGARMGRA